jgi:hypothetical protein
MMENWMAAHTRDTAQHDNTKDEGSIPAATDIAIRCDTENQKNGPVAKAILCMQREGFLSLDAQKIRSSSGWCIYFFICRMYNAVT